MRATFTSSVFALFVLVFIAASAVRAEGLFVPIVDKQAVAVHILPTPPDHIRPHPLPPNPSALPFRITSSKVSVRIDENVATTSVEQTFLNLSGRDLEVKMLYPLPAGSAINNSSLSMNGSMIEGKLYNADEAMRIYQSIVQQRRDPALMRYAGESLYEASIFPVPPNQERKLKFSYTQLLTASAGVYDYRHLLSTSKQYEDGIEKFELTCTIRSKAGLGPVYSSSHTVDIQRPDANTATVTLNASNLSSENDLRIYYAPANGAVAFRILTHRVSESEDGYFMLIGRADESLQNVKMPAKEIVFVVDRSGSMQGPKIQQTRNALKFCLNSLSPSDRFNLITFSTDVEGLSGGDLIQATPENIKKALAGVDQIEATGGTNIDGALRAALGSNFTAGGAAAKMVIFMTDGLPTTGVTDMGSILSGVKSSNPNKVRFFNFGVGDDVNTHLLDQLALDQDGTCSYVSPLEDIEIKVSDFFAKVKNPVMTEAAFDYGTNAGANSVYPRKIPALFKGGEFVLLGRYKGTGPGEIVLTGNVSGEQKKIVMPVDWPSRSLDNSFLPRVWAMRKIGFLLEDMRLHGQNQEVVKEIVDLATRHGIVTPYTSQLVLEPGMTPTVSGRTTAMPVPLKPADALARQLEARKDAGVESVASAKNARDWQSGDAATALSGWEKDLQQANNYNADRAAASTPASAASKSGATDEKLRQRGNAMKASQNYAVSGGAKSAEVLEQAQEQMVRNVGARTFYNRGGVWVDSQAKLEQKRVVVKQFTPEYFELLKKDREMGQVLALGGQILVNQAETVYQVEE